MYKKPLAWYLYTLSAQNMLVVKVVTTTVMTQGLCMNEDIESEGRGRQNKEAWGWMVEGDLD